MTKPSKRSARRSGYLPGAGEMPLPSGDGCVPKEAPDPSREEPGAKAAGAAREETTGAFAQRELVRLYIRIAKDFEEMARDMVDAASRVRL